MFISHFIFIRPQLLIFEIEFLNPLTVLFEKSNVNICTPHSEELVSLKLILAFLDGNLFAILVFLPFLFVKNSLTVIPLFSKFLKV